MCLLSLVEVKQDKFKLHLLELKQNYLGAGSHSNCILWQTINIEENLVKYQTFYFKVLGSIRSSPMVPSYWNMDGI